MKIRKKPIVLDAIQWTGDNYDEVKAFYPDCYKTDASSCLTFIIPTLEGDLHVSKGDIIVKGVEGEFYPIKHAIFLKTYDIVENI